MKKVMVRVNHCANPDQSSCAARGAEKIAAQLETKFAQHLTLQDVPRLMVELTDFADANSPAVSPDQSV